jgi:ribosomal protein S13
MVDGARKLDLQDEDVRTIQEIVLNRKNFQTSFMQWCCPRSALFCGCCSDKYSRSGQLFEKGRRKIERDLDLRTYIKSVRHV